MAKIDFTYECADCGAEIRQTVIKPALPHLPAPFCAPSCECQNTK